MPTSCVVADCHNNAGNTKGRNVIYHWFPVSNKSLCKKWAFACKNKTKINYKSSRICSEHFRNEDYERDLKNELLSLPLRRKLKPSSVPSVFLNRGIHVVKDSDRKKRADIRKRKSFVEEIIKEYDNKLNTAVASSDLSTQGSTQDRGVQTKKYLKITETKLEKAEERLRRQAVKIKSLLAKNNYLRTMLRNEKARKGIQLSCFSQKQRKKLLMKKVCWSNEDIIKSMAMRSISLKAYDTARTVWKLPLPSPRTLRRRIANFKCEPGIFKEVLQIMGEFSSTLQPWQRACCMSFDEMNISSRIVFDKSIDSLSYGSKVQVVMVRGLFDKWKQPVYYKTDTKITKSLLLEIISAVEKAGYPVLSITSDMGGDNVALWKELELTLENPNFMNPVAARKVHVFADVPHMLKLIRNHILDDGLQLSDGTVIDKSMFEELLKHDNAELKLCPKFTQRILELQHAERMRVRPAAQLLSNHVACLARKVHTNSKMADFIQLVNESFDVMNSRVLEDNSSISKAGFQGTPQQLHTLKSFVHVMKNARFFISRKGKKETSTKKALLPCQKGFIMSARSTINLFRDCKEMYEDAKYILTSRMNQDCLESLFSRIRAFGGSCVNPTAVEFKYRLRLILLGSQVRSPKLTNSEYDFNPNFISATLISRNEFYKNSDNSMESLPPSRSVRGRATEDYLDKDTLLYLAGYVAWKMKRSGHGIHGVPTSGVQKGNWIQMISRGGLLTPTPEMLQWILECNQLFNNFMNTQQGSGTGLLQSLKSYILATAPHINPVAIQEFLKIRIKIRVNFLNSSNKSKMSSRINRKKAQQFASSTNHSSVNEPLKDLENANNNKENNNNALEKKKPKTANGQRKGKARNASMATEVGPSNRIPFLSLSNKADIDIKSTRKTKNKDQGVSNQKVLISSAPIA